jgi:hypothetical protein
LNHVSRNAIVATFLGDRYGEGELGQRNTGHGYAGDGVYRLNESYRKVSDEDVLDSIEIKRELLL